eukprot:scaffold265385_cov17-Tisochrysis_lutea.AAC.1
MKPLIKLHSSSLFAYGDASAKHQPASSAPDFAELQAEVHRLTEVAAKYSELQFELKNSEG